MKMAYRKTFRRYTRTAPMALGRFATMNRSRIMARRRGLRKGYSNLKIRRRYGERIGQENAKRVQTSTVQTTFRSSRVLYNEGLMDIPKAVTLDQNLNRRVRDMVNISGIQLTMEVNNADAQIPQLCNFAVIAPKQGASGVNASHFFRAMNQGAARSIDFSLALSSNEMHTLPINSDRYLVFWHKRFMLNPRVGGTEFSANSGKSYRIIKKYIKLRRQVRFDNVESQPESGQIWLVYWFDRFGAPQNGPVRNSVTEVSIRAVVYFREPKT